MSGGLLYLWPDKRDYFRQEIDFYLDQADKRVLAQFGNLEEEADQFARDAFDRMGQYAPPDADPGDYADAAWDKGINHYQMLTELSNRMILSIAAGLYHEWEKQLRGWLVQELNHNFSMDALGPLLWKKKIEELLDLLKGLGWDATAFPFFDTIDECRLVVNVSKHGLGPAFDDLKSRFPHHLGPIPAAGSLKEPFDIRNHNHLKIVREDLGRFQQTLKDFWTSMPRDLPSEDAASVPGWFEKALAKK